MVTKEVEAYDGKHAPCFHPLRTKHQAISTVRTSFYANDQMLGAEEGGGLASVHGRL
ncbi:MAG: hypothetical protein AAF399_20625 [Bacteroidota bacterium]